MIDFKITALADPEIVYNVGTIVGVFCNDVDDSGNSVRPVGCTSAILQDFQCGRLLPEIIELMSTKVSRRY